MDLMQPSGALRRDWPPSQTTSLRQKLAQQLFASSKANAYAVLDGAANPALLDHLYGERPEFVCLYRGELRPDVAECAPYLAQLQLNTRFTDWVLSECWGKYWGIFLVAALPLQTVRQHLRKFNMVYDPEDKQPMLFRYYDPRVLGEFLPNCDPHQAEQFFGQIHAFLAETTEVGGLRRYGWQNQRVRSEEL